MSRHNTHRRPRSAGSRRHLITGTALVCATGVAMGGTAYAYVTQDGSDTRSASVGAGGFTFQTAVATPVARLYPGDPPSELYLKILPVAGIDFRVISMAPRSGTVVVTNSGPGGCDGSVVTVAAKSGLSIDVIDDPVETTVSAVVTMSPAALPGCQGATFAIPVLLVGEELP